uniref:Uncharacterized protein LOC111115979 isoform X6 n=1 Tax=Crassostrea virginica TaxID=6565 RepID=A0A8B8C707_CRAVI|nr:uncharacterized protein LOC111115979 isoform X6 [Crassostrea virginica]
MSEKKSFNNDSPKTSILLEKNFFINNYKALKKQMEPDEIIDYLVQYHILDTDENTRLIDKGRSRKCDFILRKCIRDPDCRSKLKELIEKETQLQEVQCFHTLLHQRPQEIEHAKVVQGCLLQNLKRKENQERLLEVFRKHINTVSFKSILDDFLQEYVINEDDHEEISGVKNRTRAAQLLLTSVERSSWLSNLIPILKSYEENELVERIQQTDLSAEEEEDKETQLKVDFVDGKWSICAYGIEQDIQEVEVTIRTIDGNIIKGAYQRVGILGLEPQLARDTHCTITETEEGSIIILLKKETNDGMTKLRQFIENGYMSLFLKKYFENKEVRRILSKARYNVYVEIKAVDPTTTVSPPQRTGNQKLRFKTCLKQCHSFLLEELEPGYFLKNEKVAPIFQSVITTLEKMTTRTEKIGLILKHLGEQPEETIKIVLDTLQEKNSFIYEQLFPNTEAFNDLDIDQVKRNIFDNLDELIDQLSIDAIRTPFLSMGILSAEELDLLRSSNTNSRMASWQFVRLVLHRGAEAIKIFLRALEQSCSEDLISRLLEKENKDTGGGGAGRNGKIRYEEFDKENGILFTGNFLLDIANEPPQTCSIEHLGSKLKHCLSSQSFLAEDSGYSIREVLRCHMCDKNNPPPYCSDCHLNANQFKNPAEKHLDALRIHRVMPIQKRLTLEFHSDYEEQKDIGNKSYEDIKCDLCNAQNPSLFCELCHVDLCKDCAKKHLSGNEVMPIKRRWSFNLTKHSFNLTGASDSLQNALQCHMCKKPHPTQFCDLCHISLCKACVPIHLFGDSRKHPIVPVKKRWSFELSTHFATKDGPVNAIKDVAPCHLCEKPDPPWKCKLCKITLCRGCAGRHHSDQFKPHKVVPITKGSSSQISKHSYKIYHFVHSIHDIVCQMCEDRCPTLHCNLCCINLCKTCAKKHLFENHRKHKIVTISKRWSCQSENESAIKSDSVKRLTKFVRCFMCQQLKTSVFCGLCHYLFRPLEIFSREAIF